MAVLWFNGTLFRQKSPSTTLKNRGERVFAAPLMTKDLEDQAFLYSFLSTIVVNTEYKCKSQNETSLQAEFPCISHGFLPLFCGLVYV